MNRLPEEYRDGLEPEMQRKADALWDRLGEEPAAVPSRRLRRRLRRLLWLERLRGLGAGVPLAGMATALVVGMILGRVVLAPPLPEAAAPEYRLETRLLTGATLAARLDAILTLRDARALPLPAARALARQATDPRGGVGVQLAALEALLAHASRPEVQALLTELAAEASPHPMLELRLRDAVKDGSVREAATVPETRT